MLLLVMVVLVVLVVLVLEMVGRMGMLRLRFGHHDRLLVMRFGSTLNIREHKGNVLALLLGLLLVRLLLLMRVRRHG